MKPTQIILFCLLGLGLAACASEDSKPAEPAPAGKNIGANDGAKPAAALETAALVLTKKQPP